MRTLPFITLALIAGAAVAACDDDAGSTAEPQAASVEQPFTEWPGVGALVTGDPSVAGGFTVEPLARGGFPDDIEATFRIKLDTRTQVVHVTEPSNALVARLTFEPGGSVGWHTHPGPVVVTVASGTLSIINASDCVLRPYGAGQAFVDPGQGNVHVGFNDTDGVTVVYATFLGVPTGQPATVPAANPGCLP